MADLVFFNGNQAVTTTLAIADGTDNQHKNVMELLRKNLADFEEFGRVAFETRNSAFETPNGDATVERSNQGRPTEYAVLNEPQSTLLITYMRNSDIVRAFKKRLVKAFYELAGSKSTESYHRVVMMVPDFIRAAEAFGFSGNQATLSANRALTHFTGINLLSAMGQTALIAPDQEQLLTVSDIGLRLGQKSREVNKRLTECGMQTDMRDHKNRLYYELTTLGQSFGVYLDTVKRHTDGTPIRQIKWRSSIIDYLQSQTA